MINKFTGNRLVSVQGDLSQSLRIRTHPVSVFLSPDRIQSLDRLHTSLRVGLSEMRNPSEQLQALDGKPLDQGPVTETAPRQSATSKNNLKLPDIGISISAIRIGLLQTRTGE